MTRRYFALLIVMLLPFLATGVAACSKPTQPGPDQQAIMQDPKYAIGAGIYTKFCAGCHGDHGQGLASLGPQINTPDWQAAHTDDQIRAVILEGRKVPGTSMDTFKGILSDDQITATIFYLRTLKP
jgi:mono/diheme cytochrome c family protein